mmetsp:Transcript_33113/g.91481  ORF Transcript_33113/g.91481 Transcript_33113/m.91481 type:complete len:257 (-) Transcript_33113:305-1075(-)
MIGASHASTIGVEHASIGASNAQLRITGAANAQASMSSKSQSATFASSHASSRQEKSLNASETALLHSGASGCRNWCCLLRSATSSSLDPWIISCIALTWPLTTPSRSETEGATSSAPSAPMPPSKERRSLGIWYSMKSCMRSWVSLISFVRLSAGRFRTFSNWGLIWMTRTPKSVLSSCIARKAFAKACCSGDSDSIASLNSFGVGIVDKSRGIVSSSLFLTIAAYLGSKVDADAMRPTRTNIELNCRARDTSDS